MPNPSGISVGKGPRPNAAQLWPARSGLMELKSKTGLLPSASTADVSVRDWHHWAQDTRLFMASEFRQSSPASQKFWTKMLHELIYLQHPQRLTLGRGQGSFINMLIIWEEFFLSCHMEEEAHTNESQFLFISDSQGITTWNCPLYSNPRHL